MRRLRIVFLLLALAACQDRPRHPIAPAEQGQPALSPNSGKRAGQRKPPRTPRPGPGIMSSGLAISPLGPGVTPDSLAQTLVGPGVTISNVVYSGANVSAGRFGGGLAVLGIEAGIVLGSGAVADAVGPNDVDGVTTVTGSPGDADLTALSGQTTHDAAVLRFDFVPSGDSVHIQYVFSSDEYNEYVNSSFNDAFALFVNGSNCARVSGQPVAINNVNGGNPLGTSATNPDQYRNNDPSDGGGGIDTEMDGLTVVLTCRAPVNPGQTNQFKIAIADAGDQSFDSNVFIRAASFSTTAPAVHTVVVTVDASVGGTCAATVTARDVAGPAFFVQRADPVTCTATFQLPAGSRYTYVLHNTVIDQVSDHEVWPDVDGAPTADLLLRQGAVFIEGSAAARTVSARLSGALAGSGGQSAVLTADNFYAAVSSAQQLLGDRAITLAFQPGGRTVQCTLDGATTSAQAYSLVVLDPARSPPSRSGLDPALGIYVDQADASGTGCAVQAPTDATVVLEAREEDGTVYRAQVPPGTTSVQMEPDPDYYRVGYISDPLGDNPQGTDDLGLVTFGLERAAGGGAGNVFNIKADFKALRFDQDGRYWFNLTELNGASTGIKIEVRCSKTTGSCALGTVSPTSMKSKVLGAAGKIDLATGNGWVQVRVDFAGIDSVKVRLSAGIAPSVDYAPNGSPVLWTRTDGGNSWDVAH